MQEAQKFLLKNNEEATARLLNTDDAELLYGYLNSLSAESRSRFGPHSFDRATVENICINPQMGIIRFIAETKGKMIAYMLIQKGMIDADRQRYAGQNIFFNEDVSVTYAPSVADDFQNSGVGSQLFELIKNQMQAAGIKNIILWGGVQESNERAVHFYTKHGFKLVAPYWHDNKNNFDMVLSL